MSFHYNDIDLIWYLIASLLYFAYEILVTIAGTFCLLLSHTGYSLGNIGKVYHHTNVHVVRVSNLPYKRPSFELFRHSKCMQRNIKNSTRWTTLTCEVHITTTGLTHVSSSALTNVECVCIRPKIKCSSKCSLGDSCFMR